MKTKFESLEELKLEINLILEFKTLSLLKVIEKSFKVKGVKSINRVFFSKEKIDSLLKNNKEKFDEDTAIENTWKSKKNEEKNLLKFFKFIFEDENSKRDFLEKFSKNSEILSFNDDFIFGLNTVAPVPNDSLYSSLWGIEKINARHVWDCTQGGDSLVAIVDTGIQLTHNDLDQNLFELIPNIYGLNLTTDNSTNFYDPTDGNSVFHGTHVAGTIAAQGNNQNGVIGVSPKSRVLAIKGLYNFGFGFLSDLSNSITLAAFLKADVINNSWGPSGPMPVIPVLNSAINFAISSNSIVVFAAGNSNIDTINVFPQNHPDVITVASVNSSDLKSGFSNFGNAVTLSAPGESILSTTNSSFYGSLNGTSMAAPHVSGAVALIRSRLKNASNTNIKRILQTYVSPHFSAVPIGSGRLNLEYISEILCASGCGPCSFESKLMNRKIENKRLKKTKVIFSGSCNSENECTDFDIQKLKPCISFHWGDSATDNIETHDNETAYIRVCNKYKNISISKLVITEIIISPNQILPNLENAITIVPSELICFNDIKPCACVSREVELITRNAIPGNYTISFKYCIEGFQIINQSNTIENIQITLINS